MTPEQREAIELARKLEKDPEAAALEMLSPEQREAAQKAKALYENPFGSAMNALPISDSFKGNILKAKEVCYDDPSMLNDYVKDQVPDDYKNLYAQGESAYTMASDLKAKKDEYQLAFVEKTIAPLISIYDINNDGDL